MGIDSQNSARAKGFTRRTIVLSAGSLVAFGGLFTRLYQLQIVEVDKYRLLAEENRINTHLLAPLRGRIFDRFGEELATNRQNFRVLLVPEDADDLEATLTRISHVLPIDERDRAKILREAKRKRGFVPVTVAENLGWRDFARVNFRSPALPGVRPDVGNTRHYPYKDILSHVVGYVGAVSDKEKDDDPLLSLPGFRVGKDGIEDTLDNRMRGTKGIRTVEVNAGGRVIRELSRQEGTPGQDLVLTLDMGLQRYTHERLAGESGAAVLMDIKTGEILALVSQPGFDPNDFNVGISTKKWRELNANKYNPLLNKAVKGAYPPGSTFKMVTSLAALEAGLWNPRERVVCRQRMTFGNQAYHCWKPGGHGSLDMRGAIKHSCNIYFYEVAKKVGVDRLAAMARRFGLGAPHDFGIPGERAGTVPSSQWKLANIGEPWQDGETLSYAIGQGFLAATPLQLAVMVARVANGQKAVAPRLVRSVGAELMATRDSRAAWADLDIAPEHMELVRDGMFKVLNEPGGTAFAKRITENGWVWAGKTGTSQIARITEADRARGVTKNEDLPWERRDHALFVGFAPYDDPRYAISVVIEHGGGGSAAAAPVAKDIMLEALRRDPAARRPFGPNDTTSIAAAPAEIGEG